MKKILIAAGIVIVLVGVAALFLFSNLNSLVAGAIEKHGSEATDTRVGVSGVDISLREGRGSITGLSVESPDGFEAREAFTLGDITIDIDIKSLRDDPIIIDEIRIQAPVVNAEVTATGESNIEALRKNVQAHTAGGTERGGEAKRIRIKRFVFEKGRIEIDASALGIEKRTLTLAEIRLNDVGGADGALPGDVAKIILTTVAKQVSSEIARSEVDQLIKKELGGSLQDKAKELLNKIGN